ncbi:unnamed protein product [Leuciscus chuanchicus]
MTFADFITSAANLREDVRLKGQKKSVYVSEFVAARKTHGKLRLHIPSFNTHFYSNPCYHLHTHTHTHTLKSPGRTCVCVCVCVILSLSLIGSTHTHTVSFVAQPGPTHTLIPQFIFLLLGMSGASLYLIRLARGPHKYCPLSPPPDNYPPSVSPSFTVTHPHPLFSTRSLSLSLRSGLTLILSAGTGGITLNRGTNSTRPISTSADRSVSPAVPGSVSSHAKERYVTGDVKPYNRHTLSETLSRRTTDAQQTYSRRLEDVQMTFSRRLEDVQQTFSRRLEDVQQTFRRRSVDFEQMFSRRLDGVQQTYSRRSADV